MACSLIEHKRINTTVAKAKALRTFVEPVISRAKVDSTHSRRMAFRRLKSKYAVTELFRTIGPAVAARDGGYTRIIRTGYRPGDNAEMCMIELVDFNTLYGTESSNKKKRTRRGGARKKPQGVVEAAVDSAVDATGAAADAVVETAESVSEAAEEATDAATDASEAVADAAGEAAEAVAEEAGNTSDAVSDDAKEGEASEGDEEKKDGQA